MSYQILPDRGGPQASQWREWRTAKAQARAAEVYARQLRPWYCHPLLVTLALLIVAYFLLQEFGAIEAFWEGYNSVTQTPGSVPA